MAFTLTQREIVRTFWLMLDERPYDEVTVLALCERCGLSRNTFYYHFADIPTLVEQTANGWFDAMCEAQGPFATLSDCLTRVAAECQQHKKPLRRLYHMSHRDVFEQGLARIVRHVVRRYVMAMKSAPKGAAERETAERFYRSMLTGVFLDWLAADMSYDLSAFVARIGRLFVEPEWENN